MTKKNLAKGLITVLCVAGFALIAYYITQDASLALDDAVQRAVFSMRSQWLTALLVPFTYSGNWQTVTLICLILLLLPRTRKRYGVPLTASALLSVGLYEILKFIFQRPRPDLAFHLITQDGFSFPSGHTLTSLVVWGVFILLLHQYSRIPYSVYEESRDFPHITNKAAVYGLTALFILYIVLMGFSRVYLGVHYPTDVLGSWCLGGSILVGMSSYYLPSLTQERH